MARKELEFLLETTVPKHQECKMLLGILSQANYSIRYTQLKLTFEMMGKLDPDDLSGESVLSVSPADVLERLIEKVLIPICI